MKIRPWKNTNTVTESGDVQRVSFWRSRLAALAILSVVSAVAITGLVSQMRAFTVSDGEQRMVISALTSDPAEALRLAGVSVGQYDTVTQVRGGNELLVDRAFVVHVTVDGISKEVYMTGGTVGDALARAGVDTAGYRLVNAQMTDPAGEGQDICLETVSYEERTETEVLEHTVRVEYTTELAKGRSQILQKGADGQVVRVYRDTLVNGEVDATVLLSERRTEPVEEIRLVGTTVGMAMSPVPYDIALDELGQPIGYESVMLNSECTAYTNDRGLCGEITSTGRVAAVGVVAVDPKVIPYGTELYIVSADGSYVYGYAIAGDTGGACKSGRIVCDLFMDTYEDCVQFGRRDMNVYILK